MYIFVYTTWFFVIVLFYMLLSKKADPIFQLKGKNIYSTNYDNTFFLFAIVLYLLAVLRYWKVGGHDTQNYVYYFQNIRNTYYYVYDPIKDVGFIFISDIIKLITDDEQVIIFFMSSFILIPIFVAIYKLSGNKVLSIAYFFVIRGSLLYFSSLATIKQYFSISLIMTGILLYHDLGYKNKKIGLLLLLAACLFHFSAVGTLIFLLFSCFRIYSNKVLYLSLIIGFLFLCMSGLFQEILFSYSEILSPFINENANRALKYMVYNENSDTHIEYLKTLPLNLFAAAMIYFSSTKDVNRRLLQALVFSVTFFDVVAVDTTGLRMAIGPMIIGCLGFPNIYKLPPLKRNIFVVLILSFMLFEALSSISSFDRITMTRSRYEPWFDYSFFFEH